MIDIGEQQARLRLVDDDPDVGLTRTDQKFGSLRFVDPVHLQAGMLRVRLQVEGRGLHRLLVWRGQPREASVKVSAMRKSMLGSFLTP